MENITLFESFLVWLCRNRREFTVSTGIVYGHKMYTRGQFTFVDLDDSVMIQSDSFNYKAVTLDELIKLADAIA